MYRWKSVVMLDLYVLGGGTVYTMYIEVIIHM